MGKEKTGQSLTESSYMILLSLLRPLHGYGIMQMVESLSGGRVRLGPGTLYGALSALSDKQVIRRVENDSGEEKKKLYVLTEKGIGWVREEHRRLNELVTIGNRVMAEFETEESNG